MDQHFPANLCTKGKYNMKLQDGIAKFSRLASLGRNISQFRLERLIKINENMQNVLASPRSAFLKQEHLPCLLLDITNNSIRLKQRRDNLGMRPNETTTS